MPGNFDTDETLQLIRNPNTFWNTKLHEYNNARFIKIKLEGVPAIIVSDIRDAHQIFTLELQHKMSRPRVTPVIQLLMDKPLMDFSADIDRHRIWKQGLSKFYTEKAVEPLLPILEKHTKLMLDNMKNISEISENTHSYKNIFNICRFWSLNIALESFLGEKLMNDCTIFDFEWVADKYDVWCNGFLDPTMNTDINSPVDKAICARKELEIYFSDLLHIVNQKFKNGDLEKNLLISRMKNHCSGERFWDFKSEDDFQYTLGSQLTGMIFSSFETTANAATNLIWCYFTEEDAIQKLKNIVLNDKLLSDCSMPLTSDLVHAFPEIKYFVKESLRVYANAIVNNRMANSDIIVNGQEILNGSRLIVSKQLFHFREQYFEDCFNFHLERFMPGNKCNIAGDGNGGKLLKNNIQAWVPFMMGNRQCLGHKLAIEELSILLITMIRNDLQLDVRKIDDNIFWPFNRLNIEGKVL